MNALTESVSTATRHVPRHYGPCAVLEERSDHLLVVSSSPESRLMLALALGSDTCPQHWVSSWREAADWSRRVPPRVVICDEKVIDGCWRDVWMEFRFAENPPAFIIAADVPDERLWAEALNLGAYDVLSKPLAAAEIHNSLRNACRSFAQPAEQS